jgi:hypothetical protein
MPGILKRWQASLDLSRPSFTPENHVLSVEHVLGQRPAIDAGPVGDIMRRVAALVGLEEVKKAFADLVAGVWSAAV